MYLDDVHRIKIIKIEKMVNMNLKILIVDDEKTICDGIIKMINWGELGYSTPKTAYDGFAALEKMEDEPFFALLTDIRLPEMSGLDLCNIVQKQYPDCKILIMSGYSEFEYARTAINLGAVTYLLKPISEEELSGVLKRLAQEEQSRVQNEDISSDKSFYMGKAVQHPVSQEMSLFKADFSPLIAAVSQINKDATMQETEKFIQMLRENCPPKISRINLCYAFVLSLLDFISEIGETPENVFGEDFVPEKFYNCSTIEELHQKLNLLCRIVLDFMLEQKKQKSERDITKVAEYINSHYHEDLTVLQLGELFYYNPSYLGRKFKSITGMSIRQYINECRIKHAKDLLITTKNPVASIALSVGYLDFDYFCNLFKKSTHVTPTQYRLLYRNRDKK